MPLAMLFFPASCLALSSLFIVTLPSSTVSWLINTQWNVIQYYFRSEIGQRKKRSIVVIENDSKTDIWIVLSILTHRSNYGKPNAWFTAAWWLDGLMAQQLGGWTDRQLRGSTAWWLDSLAAWWLGGLLDGLMDRSTAQRHDGSEAWGLKGSTARRLSGSTAWRLDGTVARQLGSLTACLMAQ